MRQSMESAYNPAYKLINQQNPGMQNYSDHNFIMNDGQNEDSEVANITDQPQNVVKLRDPKHIEGFGSEVVHVNVSCSQTLPEK